MSKWRDLLPSSALAAGDIIEIDWQGDDLLLYRTTAGKCIAITAYCPHMGNYIPNGLAAGQELSTLLEHGEIRCPYHGWRFDGAGRCTHIPQGQHIPIAVKRGRAVARIWQVRESGRQIQIACP